MKAAAINNRFQHRQNSHLLESRNFIAGEEKSVPGFKASNGRLTFLLGGDSAGDFKVKTRLIYYSEYSKSTLPVLHK